MMTDPIADMLTRIRNANERKHKDVTMPHSRIKADIAKILKEEGFITNFSEKELENNKKELHIELKYRNNQRVITGIRRISKPGLRQFVKAEEVPTVLNGLGCAIISTSAGIMTDKAARKSNTGGEVLLFVW